MPERRTPTSPSRPDWKSFSGEPAGMNKDERAWERWRDFVEEEADEEEEFIWNLKRGREYPTRWDQHAVALHQPYTNLSLSPCATVLLGRV